MVAASCLTGGLSYFGPERSAKFASWVPPGAFRKGRPSLFPRAMTGKIETRINSQDNKSPFKFCQMDVTLLPGSG
jgi:hypothetical protein